MSHKKLLLSSVIIGVLAGLIMLLTNIFQTIGFISPDASLTFVTFLTWAAYIFFGATPKDAIISWMSFAVGIACAIIIFLFGDLFSGIGLSTAYMALPFAVTIGVFLMCTAEKLPYGNRVPAVFLGSATFFGLMGIPSVSEAGYVVASIGQLAYSLLGLFAGYLSVNITNAFQKSESEIHQ